MQSSISLERDLPVAVTVRMTLDLDSHYPEGATCPNEVAFQVHRGNVLVDQFVYDMRVTYRGRVALPSYVVRDNPGAGVHEYRLAIVDRRDARHARVTATPSLVSVDAKAVN